MTEALEIVLRHIEAPELGAYWATAAEAFGWREPPDGTDMGEWLGALADPNRMLAAVEGEAMVGVAGAFPFKMTVPGGEVPAAGVTHVGVAPTRRRRGILTRMMHVVLDDALAAGEPVAFLWASEDLIYQRFGFGMTAQMADVSIERHKNAFLEQTVPTGRVRTLTVPEALDALPGLYERVRVDTPGAFARSRVWWERHRLWDRPREREGATALRVAVWEKDGPARAYAIWRVRPGWGSDGPAGQVVVHEAAGLDPEAIREIWRFLLDIDLTTKITADLLPADHPLQYLLAEPRRLGQRLRLPLWLRVVDVEEALERRAYAAHGEVVFELADRFRPANQGRWHLEAEHGKGRCERTDEAPDLRLSVNDLGAAYLGWTPLGSLARAGRVTELTEGAVARAEALFRWPRAPWCPEIF